MTRRHVILSSATTRQYKTKNILGKHDFAIADSFGLSISLYKTVTGTKSGLCPLFPFLIAIRL